MLKTYEYVLWHIELIIKLAELLFIISVTFFSGMYICTEEEVQRNGLKIKIKYSIIAIIILFNLIIIMSMIRAFFI